MDVVVQIKSLETLRGQFLSASQQWPHVEHHLIMRTGSEAGCRHALGPGNLIERAFSSHSGGMARHGSNHCTGQQGVAQKRSCFRLHRQLVLTVDSEVE